jgi:hypothetical protein
MGSIVSKTNNNTSMYAQNTGDIDCGKNGKTLFIAIFEKKKFSSIRLM